MNFPSPEYDDAVAAACHGTLGDAPAEALHRLLRDAPAALDEYVARVGVHAALAVSTELFAGAPGMGAALPPLAGSRRPRLVRPARQLARTVRRMPARPSRAWLSLAAAAALLIGALGWLVRQRRPPEAAVLVSTAAAAWDSGERPAAVVRASDVVRLAAGRARLDFASGARLALEGPAALEILSGAAARLQYGLAVCEVGARGGGFRLGAADLTAVDLGTAFGARLTRGGRAEVHVLAGRVRIEGPAGVRREVAEDMAVRGDPGALVEVPAARSAFSATARLLPGVVADTERRRAAWGHLAAAIAGDPATLVYFDGASRGDSLPNRATGPGRGPDGRLHGTAPAEGRWPGEAARRFRGGEDHVVFEAAGRQASLTLLAWLRVDALPRDIGALVMSLGAAEEGGRDIHWELGRQGALTLSRHRPKHLRPAGTAWDQFHAPGVLRPEHVSEWLLLATTADAVGGEVVHYLNGRAVARLPLSPGDFALCSTRIGNTAAFAAYAFTGAVDELVISRRAYNESEIRNIYEVGKP